MAMIFAAQHPERTRGLVLYGATARWLAAAADPAGFVAMLDSLAECWGEGAGLPMFAPSRVEDPAFREWWAGLQRMGASPGMARELFALYARIDVRDILDTIHVPTLVLHRRGDRAIPIEGGRCLAAHIPGARLVELDGIDHVPYVGDSEQVLAEIEEFLTGSRPHTPVAERVLATVLFVDVVGSTALAARAGVRFLEAARRELDRYSGTEVDVAGDGLLATFGGPARAIRCAVAIREAAGALGLQIRAGVHAGEVERDDDGGVSGLAVHIGARVMAEAAPGEVLVSGTVKDLVVGSGLRFTERGVRTLRGVPGSWPLFAVQG
jgi:class 3 adenylate cyclase